MILFNIVNYNECNYYIYLNIVGIDYFTDLTCSNFIKQSIKNMIKWRLNVVANSFKEFKEIHVFAEVRKFILDKRASRGVHLETQKAKQP